MALTLRTLRDLLNEANVGDICIKYKTTFHKRKIIIFHGWVACNKHAVGIFFDKVYYLDSKNIDFNEMLDKPILELIFFHDNPNYVLEVSLLKKSETEKKVRKLLNEYSKFAAISDQIKYIF